VFELASVRFAMGSASRARFGRSRVIHVFVQPFGWSSASTATVSGLA